MKKHLAEILVKCDRFTTLNGALMHLYFCTTVGEDVVVGNVSETHLIWFNRNIQVPRIVDKWHMQIWSVFQQRFQLPQTKGEKAFSSLGVLGDMDVDGTTVPLHNATNDVVAELLSLRTTARVREPGKRCCCGTHHHHGVRTHNGEDVHGVLLPFCP